MRDNQLEELVPSLGLCKKIPEGSFTDSVLEWYVPSEALKRTWGEQESVIIRHHAAASGLERNCPAPTLHEIMDQLTRMDLCPELRGIVTVKGEFIYTLRTGLKTFCQQLGESVEDMVLRAWLYFQKEREETSISHKESPLTLTNQDRLIAVNNSEAIEYRGKKYCRVFDPPRDAVNCVKCCFASDDECGAPEPFTGCAIAPLSHWEEVKENKEEK